MTLYAFMFDILSTLEIIPELRKEMIQVLTEDGSLTKQSLYKLKLLDSCLKESQRISNFGPTSLHRRVERPVTLSDGTFLPKGCITAFPTLVMHDPEMYGPDPLKFDGRRYLRMRQQPGQENKGQFVTTSADHFGFGHGKFACPGRFMAANVLKIMIVHLLLRYDWKLAEGARKSLVESELRPDPSTVVLCKLRTSEFETF
ncbi:Cytochrome P450 monooxygenase pyr3 [Lasiodiplodia hormozganensis]|uniref:Cytochrome P450 monooxygenase pyr3 n=1 Tax=Lasiodiplodia hormozganensis TaxID=869390 RepID=A0AA39WHC0_9PEZI|nr:Cytochrome P450 monooxygenase pyr3 [Lasiodiplodia hormozganensis]